MGMPSMPELIIILLIILVLFGAKKIPTLMKGLGSGIRDFKKEMNKEEEENLEAKSETKIEQNETTANQESTPASNSEAPKTA